MNLYIRRTLFFLFLIFSFLASEAASVKLNVSSEGRRREIGVGEKFYILYTLNDIDETPPQPASVPGSKVLYFTRSGQSSSFTSINGNTTHTVSYTYTLTLRAEKEGQYSFGPVTIGGVTSNKVNFTIGPPAPDGPPVTSNRQPSTAPQTQSEGPKYIGKGDGNLFLRAEVSKSSVYEQEALVYTVKLYTTYDAIKFIGATAAPKFEGFVVEESSDVSNQLTYETYNGKSYASAVIARYIIFPQMAGKLKVLGNTYTVSVDEREYYSDPIFRYLSVPRHLQLNVSPNDLVVDVKALPKPAPADFTGGVGQFKLTSSLPSQDFKSNQAASVIYTLSGSGNIKYVTMPDLNKIYPPQLEVYSPTTNVDVNVGRSNVSGSVRYDYSFMPLETGNFAIPSVSISYFNPNTGQYEKTTASGFNISVGQGVGSQKSQTKSRLSFNKELLPLNNTLVKQPKAFIEKFGYWLFYIVPVVLLIIGIIYYRNYLRTHADILAVKSRKANKLAYRRLRKAEICMSKSEVEEFYDEMLKALWGYLSDKMKIPVSALSRENVSENLSRHNVSEEDIAELISLIDECEFSKYSPEAKNEMAPVYSKGVSIINKLEDDFRKSRKM